MLPFPRDDGEDGALRETQAAPVAADAAAAAPSSSRLPKPLSRPAGVALTILADLLALSLAFESARRLRLSLGGWLFVPLDAETLHHLMPPIWLVLAVWLVSAWWARLYRPRKGSWGFNTIVHVIESMALATTSTVVLSFAIYENSGDLSRAFVALLFACGVTFALVLRAGIWIGGRVARVNVRPMQVLVVGGGDDTPKIIQHLLQAKDSHIEVCGLITAVKGIARPASVRVLGTTGDLRRAINQTRADRVLVVDTELPSEVLVECIDVCAAMHIPLNCTGGGLTRFPTVMELGGLAGLRLLEVRRREFERTQDIMKRAADLTVAVLALLAVLPLCLILATTILLTSPGPVLYLSDRVGRGGRHFRCLKFRSMVNNADTLRHLPHGQRVLDGHLFKVPADSRITSVGRLMRRLSLDEVPQFWNVLCGDMSIVGPRPLPASDLDADGLSERYRMWSIERSSVRPGMTGLWQVRGRSRLPFEEMVRLDLLYIRTRSFLLDLQIALETVPAVFFGRGAM
ncbi:MAG: exopolysaccharide biosynthesis polyprenyl glycosylphosphotransferase [Vicinamibacterales bacterium]